MPIDLGIQEAFLDGIEEIFGTMFTDTVMIYLLDEEETVVNIYGESKTKKYKEPIEIISKVSTTFTKGEEPIEAVVATATFTIPTKQLITNEIPHETLEDLEALKKAKMSYNGYEYLVFLVQPKTHIADKWQTYDLICVMDKQSSK